MLSEDKTLGMLQDAGNATTLAHYLALLDKAGVVCGIGKYHAKPLERRRSTPRASLAAIEVKSGRTKPQGGMAAFLRKHPEAIHIVIGGSAAGSCTLEDFLLDCVELPWG